MKKRNQHITIKIKKQKRIKTIQSNFFLNQWIWITLAISFMISIILFTTLFTLKNKNKINLNYILLTILSLIPFILFILYWSSIIIVFRLIFKTFSTDIEKDSVFPFASSFLIKEEITIKRYIQKGNIGKIKGYKTRANKILFYMVVILFLFILFNFIFVGLTQLNVIKISTAWLYLFGLVSNIISLVLSAIFGFMVSNVINSPLQFEEKYKSIKNKLYQFKIFLNVTDIKKINHKELEYQKINFLPLYFYQSLLTNTKKEHYIQELENWKNYLNLSVYLNQFSWLLYLHYIINKKEHLKLIKKIKYMNKLAFQIKKVHKILFYNKNDFLYFNDKFDTKKLENEYSYLINILTKHSKKIWLRMITTSLEKNGLKITQTISENKDENIIDERDIAINLYQLNYLEYLFSIIFTENKKN